MEFRRKFNNLISLNDLKSHATAGGPLENLQTLKQSRLSVSSVTPQQWKFIMGLADEQEQEQEDPEENQGDQDEDQNDGEGQDTAQQDQEQHDASEGDSKATFMSAPEERTATSE